MTFFETIAVAVAMFSAIPCPQPVWSQKNMRYSLCAFPLIGVVCGLAFWGWTALCMERPRRICFAGRVCV